MHVGLEQLYSFMKDILGLFCASRRGAVAVIFALSIVPLVLFVALSIDYGFYVQARAQTLAAADAAATNAVRAADNVYTYETYPANASKYPNASADAQNYGQQIGQLWFDAALGVVPTSTVPLNPPIQITQNTNTAGFTAQVNFTGTYPPFFDTLFGHSSTTKWNLNGTATAVSNYNNVEILMLLDDSSSMLIGASGATMKNSTLTNIQEIENLSVCPSNAVSANAGGNSWTGEYDQNVTTSGASAVNQSGFLHYVSNGITNGEGYCAAGYGGTVGTTKVNGKTYNLPFSPCAFACHTQSNSEDLYGLIEQDTNGIQLRLNVLQNAAGQVITSLQNTQQGLDQFSVGVYEFNNTVTAVYPNDGSNEAGYDLATAATDIANAPAPVQSNASIGNTDFAQSVTQLVCGSSGTKNLALKAGGNGNTSANPQKDIFIVTDGMEDNSDSGSRVEGEMTSYNVEAAAAQNLVLPCGTSTQNNVSFPLCAQLKALKFTVYVLYIDYSSLPNEFFATNSTSTNQLATTYTDDDYDIGKSASQPTIDYAEQASQSTDPSFAANPPSGAVTMTVPAPSPDEVGLEGCASAPTDFIEASSDTDIATDLQVLLHSALTSTIQISQ